MKIQSINNNYRMQNQTNFNGVILIKSNKLQTLEVALNKAKEYYRKQGISAEHFYPSTSENGLTEYSAMIFTKENTAKFFKNIVKSVKSGYLKIKDKFTGIMTEEPVAQKGSLRTAQILEFVNGELKSGTVKELNANQIINRQFEQMNWVLK